MIVPLEIKSQFTGKKRQKFDMLFVLKIKNLRGFKP